MSFVREYNLLNDLSDEEIAKPFCEIFDVAVAPRHPVAFVVVMLCRLQGNPFYVNFSLI